MAGCQRALDRSFEAARDSDPETHSFLLRLYGEEKASAKWYRRTYGEMTGRHPASDALPTLEAEQIVRRAASAG